MLYLGEINDSQQEAWCRVIEAFDEGAQQTTQLALFPADLSLPDHAEGHGVRIRLGAMELHRPRQWGACWLACQLYEQLGLDRFWAARLPNSREGTCWSRILETLAQMGEQSRFVLEQLVEAAVERVLFDQRKVSAEQIAHGALLEPQQVQTPFAARIDKPVADQRSWRTWTSLARACS